MPMRSVLKPSHAQGLASERSCRMQPGHLDLRLCTWSGLGSTDSQAWRLSSSHAASVLDKAPKENSTHTWRVWQAVAVAASPRLGGEEAGSSRQVGQALHI